MLRSILSPAIRPLAGSAAGGMAASKYIGNSLLLDFAAGKYQVGAPGALPADSTFNSLVTFTRASSATYFDSSGVLQTAATNVPRFDHDPVTLQPRGLLIEEARTNLLTYSEQFDNAVWVKSRAAVEPNSIVSPSGDVTGSKVIGTASGTGFLLQRTGITAAGASQTQSFYLKKGSLNFACVAVVDTALANGARQWFNLGTGTLGSANTFGAGFSTTSASVEDVGGGWFRCNVTAAVTGGSYGVIVYPAVSSNLGFGFTVGDFGFIWGAQLEAGAFPTSYIPTVASQVTRAADVASVNTLSPWYNATEGTLFVECYPTGITTGNTTAAFSDNTTSNTILIGQFFSSVRIGSTAVGGALQGELLRAALPANAEYRFAFAFKADDFAGSVNGGSPLVDTSGAIPTVTKLNIGALNGFSQKFCGHIRAIRYFPRKLSNSELQAITV